MKPESQRIAIGEFTGELNQMRWSFRYWVKDGPAIESSGYPSQDAAEAEAGKLIQSGFETSGMCAKLITPERLPDYLNDLNAIAAAVKLLPRMGGISDSPMVSYVHNLHTVAGKPGDMGWGQATATAAQRAEAFLRTIGKWTA